MHRQKSSTTLFVPFSSAVAIAVLIAARMLAQTDPPRSTVGHQDNGSIVLASNQVITPLGIQIDLPLARPNVVAVRPDGQTAAFLAATVATPIRIANLVTGKEVQEFLPGADRSIFVEEDDEQDGVDHVDGQRNQGMVISPFARHGKVVDEYYTQVNVDRTIEQIFGLPPMNQFDLAASPMLSAFTDTLDRTPHTFLQNNVPLNDLNPQTSALNGVRRAWAQASLKMFAGNRYKPDAENPALLNRAIWYASTDFKKPYPGDPKVYLPKEVPKNRGWVADRD